MKLVTRSLVIAGLVVLFIVFAKPVFGVIAFFVTYFSLSFGNGDLKIKKGKLYCDSSNAKQEQLEGLA